MKAKDWKYLPLDLLLHAMAFLPMWILYGIADFAFVILCYAWGYRKKIVMRNPRASFPGKTEKELRVIARKFYRRFADQVFETVKLLHISDKAMRRRTTFAPDEMKRIDRCLSEKRPIVVFFSHCFNWEWVPSVTLWSTLRPGTDAEFCQIYRPLRNKWFDAIMLRMRSRFHSVSLAKKVAFLDLMRYKRRDIPTITGFMSDQHPSAGDPGCPVMFLNHPTAMITGTETVARRLDAMVIYWDIHRLRRGHYHVKTHFLTDDPGSLPEGELTRTYARMLQQTIERDPANWLWTHNRWKHPVTLPENHSEK